MVHFQFVGWAGAWPVGLARWLGLAGWLVCLAAWLVVGLLCCRFACLLACMVVVQFGLDVNFDPTGADPCLQHIIQHARKVSLAIQRPKKPPMPELFSVQRKCLHCVSRGRYTTKKQFLVERRPSKLQAIKKPTTIVA